MQAGRPTDRVRARRPACAALVAFALALSTSAAAAELAALRRQAEARDLLRRGDLAGAQRVEDALLADGGTHHALVVATGCGDAAREAVDARLDMVPLWVLGPADRCVTLAWGDFGTDDEARAAAQRIPADRVEGAARVIELRPPLGTWTESGAPATRPAARPPSASAQPPEPAPAPPARAEAAPVEPSTQLGLGSESFEGTAAELFARGNEAYEREDHRGAAAAYEASIAKDPKNASAYNNLGTARLILGDAVAAEMAFRKAVQLNPNYVKAWLNLGTALYSQKRGEEALDPMRRAVAIDPRSVDARVNLASLLAELRRLDDARDVLEDALAFAPDDVRLQRKLEDVEAQLGVRSGDVGAHPEGSPCSDNVSRARRLRLAATLFEDGRSAYERGDSAAAEAALERALDCDPTSGAILNHLGAARLAAGDADGALKAWELAARVEPERIEPAVNVALALRDLGRCDEAVERLRAVTAQQPQSGEAAFQLGRMLFLCGRPSEAATALDQARTLSPQDDRARRLLDRIDSGQVFAP